VLAEGVGTFVLVFFAVGSAVFGADRIGAVGVALAFGLVLLALAYALGAISGCHDVWSAAVPPSTSDTSVRLGLQPQGSEARRATKISRSSWVSWS
jgi:hypothetical protein